MRFTTAILAALAAMAGSVAFAGGPEAPAEQVEMCFDKGTLSYFPCPTEKVVEEVVVYEEVEEHGFWYVGLRGGYAGFTDVDYFVDGPAPAPGTGKVEGDYNSGWTVGGHIGYQLAPFSHHFDVRFEFEVAYQTAEIDTHRVIGGAILAAPSGDTSNLAFYVNAYGDTHLTERLDLVLGGGLGVAHNKFDNHATDGTVFNDSSDTAFSFHLDAGLAYDVTESLTLEALYRYTDTVDIKSEAVGDIKDSTSLDSHQALLGLRFAFN